MISADVHVSELVPPWCSLITSLCAVCQLGVFAYSMKLLSFTAMRVNVRQARLVRFN